MNFPKLVSYYPPHAWRLAQYLYDRMFSASIRRMANKYEFFIPIVVDNALSPTWIHHTVVLNRYVSDSIIIYLSMESYILLYPDFSIIWSFSLKYSEELIPILNDPSTGKFCTSHEVKLYLI